MLWRRRGGGRIGSHIAPVVLSAFALSCLAATPEQVDKAIGKGQQFLLSRQNKDGNWELVARPELSEKDNRQTDFKARQWGGLTSIATYALLASGVSAQDAKIKPAIEFLQKANIQSTYGMGLCAQVWQFVPDSRETKAVMAHELLMLEQGMIRKGENAGFYAYWTGMKKGTTSPHWTDNMLGFGPQPTYWHDLSNSQYAVLGMWALAEGGMEVPIDYWKKVEDAWKKAQAEDGGWRYTPDREEAASMTAAGIATLFITQDYTLPDRFGACTGGTPNPNIQKGLAWMDQKIEQVLGEANLYTMYGIERIGVASGRKYFGAVDWYQKGADVLVQRQAQDGSWGGDIPDTCFALLFLSRGRAPVMMNKLQYDPPKGTSAADVWGERPRDAANLARWSGHELERDLNWQIVNLKVEPEELHDAPILYIAGNQPLAFNDKQVNKLRTFVQEGGLILGNADCGQQAFAESFKELGAKMFPVYEFRQLPASHLIFTREQYRADNWRVRRAVLGLSNGVRELMLLVPDADPARAWQTRSDRSKQELFQLGTDIFLYSIDKRDLRNKGETYLAMPDANIQATRKMKVARLMVGGNPDPEPYGWKRLAAVMHNRHQVDLSVFNATPGGGSLVAARIAHLTGTTTFTLKESARAEIKAFVNNGGTLIVDAAGGSSEFATSAQIELRMIFGASSGELDAALPLSSPVYNQPGMNIEKVAYRMLAREGIIGNTKVPRIRGISVGGKVRVFYSREDLSAGLVGAPVDGVYGYDPTSATDLMAAMLLYAGGK